jgi:hypothetical protein
MIRIYIAEFRDGLLAFEAAKRTTRGKGATGRHLHELRHVPRDGREDAPLESGRGGQQSLRVGMPRGSEHLLGGALFHDAPGVHHRDAIRDLGGRAQIVSNKEQGQFQFMA